MPFYSIGRYDIAVELQTKDALVGSSRTRFTHYNINCLFLSFSIIAAVALLLPGLARRKKIHPARWLIVPVVLCAITQVWHPEKYICNGCWTMSPLIPVQFLSLTVILGAVCLMKKRARIAAVVMTLGISYIIHFLSTYQMLEWGQSFRAEVATGSLLWTIPAVLGFFAVAKKFTFTRLSIGFAVIYAASWGVTELIDRYLWDEIGYRHWQCHLLPLAFLINLILFMKFSRYYRERILLILGIQAPESADNK